MTQLMSTERGEGRFPVGSRERPDPAGIVRRGEAVGFRGYVERYGEPPVCFVGRRYDGPDRMAPRSCERPAVMEVYGIPMCAPHGEEAAAGAMEEIAYDLENELQRPINAHVRPLSPHLVAALRHGFGSLSAEAEDAERRSGAALLEAFPLERGVADAESVAYAEDPAGAGRRMRESPYDTFLGARMLLCRLMRLAFEAGADWLVETLEYERESAAAQAAYALALEREAGLRPGGEGSPA